MLYKSSVFHILRFSLKQLLNVRTTNFLFLLDGSVVGVGEGNHLYFRSVVVYSNILCFLNSKYTEETNVQMEHMQIMFTKKYVNYIQKYTLEIQCVLNQYLISGHVNNILFR